MNRLHLLLLSLRLKDFHAQAARCRATITEAEKMLAMHENGARRTQGQIARLEKMARITAPRSAAHGR